MWREHVGFHPEGLGSVPKLFDDQAWWVRQEIGIGRHRVWRMGLGDAAGDLSAFNLSVGAGDTYLNAGEYDNAVTAYQAAGQSGVTTIGPEIDVQTGGASKPLTQQAWAINGNLASVTSSGASASDAQNAQGFARQMQNLYNQAIALPAAGGGGSITPSTGLVAAAQAVVNRINSGGCSQNAIAEVSAFQTAYNAEGSVALSVDGKYGPDTQAAVQRVLDVSSGGTAPANCFPGGGGGTVTPSNPLIVPVTVTGSTKTNWTPWIIGGAAVGGAGIIGYAYWKRHKRGRR